MTQKKLKLPRWMKISTIVASLCFLIVIALYFISFSGGLSGSQEVWGQFGDYVGGFLNPIFAFAGFVALLYTIVLQSTELQNSTEQLEKSAEALARQNNLIHQQTFETTFFQLLGLYNETVRNLRIEEEAGISWGARDRPQAKLVSHEGRACIAFLRKHLVKNFLHQVDRGDFLEQRAEAINEIYVEFYREYGAYFGHYFRTLYNIVKMVDRSSLSESQKQEYVALLRAQLSKEELALLLYNVISRYGREKFLPFVQRYNLLKHLEPDVLAAPNDGKMVGNARGSVL